MYPDVEYNRMLSDAVVRVLEFGDPAHMVGGYATLAWFEPEPLASQWPSLQGTVA